MKMISHILTGKKKNLELRMYDKTQEIDYTNPISIMVKVCLNKKKSFALLDKNSLDVNTSKFKFRNDTTHIKEMMQIIYSSVHRRLRFKTK